MEDKEDHSKRPEDTNFKQQRLKAWQPLLTPAYVIATFFVIGIVFIPIGAVIYSASANVVELTTRYDDQCSIGSTCTLTINVEKEMKGPVYFYYRLTNFYQNHRRYVKSRSDDQLAGTSVSSTSACDPLTSDANSVGLYPCGLIANSVFNDSYSFSLLSGGSTSTPQALQTEISWKSDRDKKFKDPGNQMLTDGSGNSYAEPWSVAGTDLTRNLSIASNGQPRAIGTSPTGIVDGVTYKGIEDEHFIVWMRTAGLPTFKKLWARFPDGFAEGDQITVTVNNQFPTSAFNGEKAVVFSTTSWLGGKNDFLGIAYLTVGCLCIALGAVFWIKHCVSPRPLGDMQYLNWPGSTSAAQRS